MQFLLRYLTFSRNCRLMRKLMYGATEIVYHRHLISDEQAQQTNTLSCIFRIQVCIPNTLLRLCIPYMQCRQSWQQMVAADTFLRVMFKILLSKSNILNFKLDEEGGVAEWDGPVDSSEAARTLHSHSRRGRVAAVVFVVVFVVLGGGVGGGSGSTVSRRC